MMDTKYGLGFSSVATSLIASWKQIGMEPSHTFLRISTSDIEIDCFIVVDSVIEIWNDSQIDHVVVYFVSLLTRTTAYWSWIKQSHSIINLTHPIIDNKTWNQFIGVWIHFFLLTSRWQFLLCWTLQVFQIIQVFKRQSLFFSSFLTFIFFLEVLCFFGHPVYKVEIFGIAIDIRLYAEKHKIFGN